MPKRSDSSRKWLKEHFSDPYVKQAQREGYRSRAAYKLLEIQQRDRILKPGMSIVDLGAAPGGWSQVAAKYVHPKGHVLAIDLLEMDPIEGVEFIQGDFTEDSTLETMLSRLPNEQVDFVLSDMAPNTIGSRSTDALRSVYLVELALDFALRVLTPEGGLLVKVFQGEGFDAFLASVKKEFKNVSVRKPKASRGRSKEVYVLARERRI